MPSFMSCVWMCMQAQFDAMAGLVVCLYAHKPEMLNMAMIKIPCVGFRLVFHDLNDVTCAKMIWLRKFQRENAEKRTTK